MALESGSIVLGMPPVLPTPGSWHVETHSRRNNLSCGDHVNYVAETSVLPAQWGPAEVSLSMESSAVGQPETFLL